MKRYLETPNHATTRVTDAYLFRPTPQGLAYAERLRALSPHRTQVVKVRVPPRAMDYWAVEVLDLVLVPCSLCAAHYGDDGRCDEGKPLASPHRRQS